VGLLEPPILPFLLRNCVEQASMGRHWGRAIRSFSAHEMGIIHASAAAHWAHENVRSRSESSARLLSFATI
jgi:hypothetical protein